MNNNKQMKLGLSMRYLGYHSAAWRHPDVPADGALSFNYFLETAKKAEAAKLDMIFFADGVAVRGEDKPKGALARDMRNVELEPLTLLSAIGSHTSHIGLVATASTTYNEPYHIARKFASMDHISGGRAGWNAVTSWTHQEALNFNRDKHLEHAERYERATEFIEVVKGLWSSWEPDAFIRNKQTGIFYDEKKVNVLNYDGKHFKVRGPLGCAATPQGRPVIVQAGGSGPGMQLGAVHADVIYSSALELEPAQKLYRDMKVRAVGAGRRTGDLVIMPGVTLYVGKTRDEARAKYQELQDLIDPISGLALLNSLIGDLSGYDIDGPVPDIVVDKSTKITSLSDNLLAVAKRDNRTIRQLYQMIGAGQGVRCLIGTPADIADDLQNWFEGEAADGFNICPPILPGGVDDLADLVLPELRRRGLFRSEYQGKTLRENLGLSWPGVNKNASAVA